MDYGVIGKIQVKIQYIDKRKTLKGGQKLKQKNAIKEYPVLGITNGDT